MKIVLRSNQIEPVRKGIEFFNAKKPVPSIIVAPTAAGKSIIIAKIVEGIKDKVLILQPSKELLEQNYNKYLLTGKKAKIYSASFDSKEIGNVTYATIGSIKEIGHKFKDKGFTKLIIDEVHLFPRESTSMLGSFLKSSGIKHVLGLTATPLKLQNNLDMNGNAFTKLVMLTSRSKKGNFFKEIIHVTQIKEMVENNFWSKLVYEQNKINEGNLKYNTSKSDFTEDSINLTFSEEKLNDKILDRLKNLNDRKSILIFVPSILEAENLSSKIKGSAVVHSKMNKKDRDIVVNGFKDLKIRVVVNVSVLSVGFDHPELDTIICARPTASLSWYYQALGRGTRIHPNKKECLIIDYSGNIERFGKVEGLYFSYDKIWKLYGEGGKLLTGIPLHEIGKFIDTSNIINVTQTKNFKEKKSIPWPYGKHAGTLIEKLPENYVKWVLENFTFNSKNEFLKKELLKLK